MYSSIGRRACPIPASSASLKQRPFNGRKHLPHCSFIMLNTTEQFIKAVSDTVLGTINAVYHDKPFIFIKAVSDTVLGMKNSVYHDKPFIFIKAVSDTVLGMINAFYRDKTLIFIEATFRKKLISHHRGGCLSRLFLTLYWTR